MIGNIYLVHKDANRPKIKFIPIIFGENWARDWTWQADGNDAAIKRPGSANRRREPRGCRLKGRESSIQAGFAQWGRAAWEGRRVRSDPEGSQVDTGHGLSPLLSLAHSPSCPWKHTWTQGRRAEQSELVGKVLIFIQQNTNDENIYWKSVINIYAVLICPKNWNDIQ